MFPAMLNKFFFTVSILCVVVDSVTEVLYIWFTTLLATVHNASERSYDKPTWFFPVPAQMPSSYLQPKIRCTDIMQICRHKNQQNYPFTDEAQTALFKDPVCTAL
jgi:hypothetical protein